MKFEQNTIQTALDNLKIATGWKASWKQGRIAGLDGELSIQVGGTPMRFPIEVKREFRNHNLPTILEKAGQWKDLMVVAGRIMPGVKGVLRQRHIPYLEGNGNIFIDKKPVFIWLDSNKPLEMPYEKFNRALSRAGLQVVFLFLTQPEYINKPYRVISQAAGTSLGNINYVIKGLLELGFLVKKNAKEFLLTNKKALLEKWIAAYEEKLKPALHIGNFHFADTHAYQNWNQADLNTTETVWGGEPAGDLLTNYLRPEIFTLYTGVLNKDLMKQLRIVPDASGPIKVYQKFWESLPTDEGKTAPPLLVYADLINTNDRRCLETAQRIYERHIGPYL